MNKQKKVPLIASVKPIDDMVLIVTFSNGQKKKMDIKPYLVIFEEFKRLQDKELFNKVYAKAYGVVWDDNLDLSYYDIWEYGEPV